MANELVPTIPTKGPLWVIFYTSQIVSLCNSYFSGEPKADVSLLLVLKDFSNKSNCMMLPQTVLVFWVSTLNALDTLMAKIISDNLMESKKHLLITILEFERNLLERTSSSLVPYSSIDRIIQICNQNTIPSELMTTALSVAIAATMHRKKSHLIPGCKELEPVLERIVNFNPEDSFSFETCPSTILALATLLQLKGTKMTKKMINNLLASFESSLVSEVKENSYMTLLNVVVRLRGKLPTASPILSSAFLQKLISDPFYYLPLLISIIQYPVGARRLLSEGILQTFFLALEDDSLCIPMRISIILIMIRLVKKVPDIFFVSFNANAGFSKISTLLKDILLSATMKTISELSFLKSILKFLLILIQRFHNREGICSFPEGPLPSFLATIVDISVSCASSTLINGSIEKILLEEFSISDGLLSMEILSSWIHSEPTSLSVFQEYKITSQILNSLFTSKSISARITEALPALLTAFSLNEPGLVFILQNHTQALEERLASAIVPDRSIPILIDPDSFGESLDELARHQPSLRHIIARSLIRAIQRLPCLIGATDRPCPVPKCFYPSRTVLSIRTSYDHCRLQISTDQPSEIAGSSIKQSSVSKIEQVSPVIEHEHLSGGWTEAVEAVSIIIELFIGSGSYMEIFCKELDGISILTNTIFNFETNDNHYGPDFDFFLGPEAYSLSFLLRHFANSYPILLAGSFYQILGKIIKNGLSFLSSNSFNGVDRLFSQHSNTKFICMTKIAIALRSFCDLWTSERKNLPSLHPGLVKDTLLFLEVFGCDLLKLVPMLLKEHWEYRKILSEQVNIDKIGAEDMQVSEQRQKSERENISDRRNTNAFLLLSSQLVSMSVVALSIWARLLTGNDNDDEREIKQNGASILLDEQIKFILDALEPLTADSTTASNDCNSSSDNFCIYRQCISLRIARVVLVDDCLNMKKFLFNNFTSFIPVVASCVRMILALLLIADSTRSMEDNRTESIGQLEILGLIFPEDVAISGAYDNDSVWKGTTTCELLGRALMDALELISGLLIVSASASFHKDTGDNHSKHSSLPKLNTTKIDHVDDIFENRNSGQKLIFTSEDQENNIIIRVIEELAMSLLAPTSTSSTLFSRFPTGTKLLILQILKFTTPSFQKKFYTTHLIPSLCVSLSSSFSDCDQFVLKAAATLMVSNLTTADEYICLLSSASFGLIGSIPNESTIFIDGSSFFKAPVLNCTLVALLFLGLQVLGHSTTITSLMDQKNLLVDHIEKLVENHYLILKASYTIDVMNPQPIDPVLPWCLALFEWLVVDERLGHICALSTTTATIAADGIESCPSKLDSTFKVESCHALVEKLIDFTCISVGSSGKQCSDGQPPEKQQLSVSQELLYQILRIFNLFLCSSILVSINPSKFKYFIKALLVLLGHHTLSFPLCRQAGVSDSRQRKPLVLEKGLTTVPGSGIPPLIVSIFRALVELDCAAIGPILAFQNAHEMATIQVNNSSNNNNEGASLESEKFKILPRPPDYVAALPSVLRDPFSFMAQISSLKSEMLPSMVSGSDPSTTSPNSTLSPSFVLSGTQLAWSKERFINNLALDNSNGLNIQLIETICDYAGEGTNGGWSLCSILSLLCELFLSYPTLWIASVSKPITKFLDIGGKPQLNYLSNPDTALTQFISILMQRLVDHSSSLNDDAQLWLLLRLLNPFLNQTISLNSPTKSPSVVADQVTAIRLAECAWISLFFSTLLSAPMVQQTKESSKEHHLDVDQPPVEYPEPTQSTWGDPGLFVLASFIRHLLELNGQQPSIGILPKTTKKKIEKKVTETTTATVSILAAILCRSLAIAPRMAMGAFSTDALTTKEELSLVAYRLALSPTEDTSRSFGSLLLDVLGNTLELLFSPPSSLNNFGENKPDLIILNAMTALSRLMEPNPMPSVIGNNILPPDDEEWSTADEGLSTSDYDDPMDSLDGCVIDEDRQLIVDLDSEDSDLDRLDDDDIQLERFNTHSTMDEGMDLSDVSSHLSEQDDEMMLMDGDQVSSSESSSSEEEGAYENQSLLRRTTTSRAIVDLSDNSSTNTEANESEEGGWSEAEQGFEDEDELSISLNSGPSSQYRDHHNQQGPTRSHLHLNHGQSTAIVGGNGPFEMLFLVEEDILIRSSSGGNVLLSTFDDEDEMLGQGVDWNGSTDVQAMVTIDGPNEELWTTTTGGTSGHNQPNEPTSSNSHSSTILNETLNPATAIIHDHSNNASIQETQSGSAAVMRMISLISGNSTQNHSTGKCKEAANFLSSPEFLFLVACRETFSSQFSIFQNRKQQASLSSNSSLSIVQNESFLRALIQPTAKITRHMPSEVDPGPLFWTLGARSREVNSGTSCVTTNFSLTTIKNTPTENSIHELRSIAMLRLCSTTARARQLGMLLDAPHDMLQPDTGRLLRRGPFNDDDDGNNYGLSVSTKRWWPVLLSGTTGISQAITHVFSHQEAKNFNPDEQTHVPKPNIPNSVIDTAHQNTEPGRFPEPPYVSIINVAMREGIITDDEGRNLFPNDQPSSDRLTSGHLHSDSHPVNDTESDDAWMDVDESERDSIASDSAAGSDGLTEPDHSLSDAAWPVLHVTPQLDTQVLEALPEDLQREILTSYFYERRQNSPGAVSLQVAPEFMDAIQSDTIRRLILEIEEEERLAYLHQFHTRQASFDSENRISFGDDDRTSLAPLSGGSMATGTTTMAAPSLQEALGSLFAAAAAATRGRPRRVGQTSSNDDQGSLEQESDFDDFSLGNGEEMASMVLSMAAVASARTHHGASAPFLFLRRGLGKHSRTDIFPQLYFLKYNNKLPTEKSVENFSLASLRAVFRSWCHLFSMSKNFVDDRLDNGGENLSVVDPSNDAGIGDNLSFQGRRQAHRLFFGAILEKNCLSLMLGLLLEALSNPNTTALPVIDLLSWLSTGSGTLGGTIAQEQCRRLQLGDALTRRLLVYESNIHKLIDFQSHGKNSSKETGPKVKRSFLEMTYWSDRMLAKGLGVLVHLHSSISKTSLLELVRLGLSGGVSFRILKKFFSLLDSICSTSGNKQFVDQVIVPELFVILARAIESVASAIGGLKGCCYTDQSYNCDSSAFINPNAASAQKLPQPDATGSQLATNVPNTSFQVLLNVTKALRFVIGSEKNKEMEDIFSMKEYIFLWTFLNHQLNRFDLNKIESLFPQSPLSFLLQSLFLLSSYSNKEVTGDTESNSVSSLSIQTGQSTVNMGEEGILSVMTAHMMPSEIATRHRGAINALVRYKPSLIANEEGALWVLGRSNPALARAVLDFENKRTLLAKSLPLRGGENGHSPAHNHHHSLKIRVRREAIFEDSFREIMAIPGSSLSTRPLSVTFEGEEGVDAGGLTREWFSVLAQQMLNPGYALFLPAAAGHGGSGAIFYPNRLSAVNPEHLLYFEFVGRVIGKAIAESQLLDCHFTRAFYKLLLGISLELDDLEAVDPAYYRSLTWIKKNATPENLAELCLFMVTELDDFGRPKVVDLVPNGSTIPVNVELVDEYIQKTVEIRLSSSLTGQFGALKKGISDVIPMELLGIFTEAELELIISGLPLIDDIEDWKQNTEYDGGIAGYNSSSPQVVWFWRVVRSMTYEERAKLLQFVTGTSKVPLGGFSLLLGSGGALQRFAIHKDTGGSHRLPQAHTCFNQLDIPEYDSYDQLRERLLKAIQESTTGFGFA